MHEYNDVYSNLLAPYACKPLKTRGRLFKEEESLSRSPYQRDRDRIIHSAAFRRLEYKTQVFVNHEGDHFRTRLTHSLEVAQLSRSVARELRLNEDLAEAVALAHDLGHPPYGHAGEDALKDVMKDYEGFDHNAQSIRILTSLEKIYADFDGLNLTWETLEGVAKHNGPVKEPFARALAALNTQYDLALHTYPSIEAQISAICDDIAYNNHDIEDGLRAKLFTKAELMELPLVGEIYSSLLKKYPNLESSRLIHEAKRRLINAMAQDLVQQTAANIKRYTIDSVEAARNHHKALGEFSASMKEQCAAIKKFLWERMYRHYKVNRMTSKAKRMVRELFTFFLNEPECLPNEWRGLAKAPKSLETAIIVSDFIAGMTDRFAQLEHARVFDLSHRIIGE